MAPAMPIGIGMGICALHAGKINLGINFINISQAVFISYTLCWYFFGKKTENGKNLLLKF